ncbi:MAG TPA: sensor histidine kinase [Flavobacteriales bacterium]|nr:sensor histidine kinase [Flavobacteriales bacterium]HMR26164.1 sensor histidine kinase [Flavobacteriales bacterium]
MREPLRALITAPWILATGCCIAQSDLDSLRALAFDRSAPDSIRFTALYDLTWDGYLFSAPDTAEVLARTLQAEARVSSDKVFEARASELFAAVQYVRGGMRTALLHYDTALSLHRRNGDLDGQADVITNMASMLSYLGELDTALALYQEGLALHEHLADSTSIANDLNAIGRVQMLRGDHGKAVDLYQQSLHIQEVLGNKRGICTSLANLGGLYLNQSDWNEALGYYRRAATMAEELDDQHQLGTQLEEIGSCLAELGDTTGSLRAYRRSESIRLGIGDHHGLVNVRNRMATLLLEQHRPGDAKALFDQSVTMAREQDLPYGLGNALVGLSTVQLREGEPARALLMAMAADSAAARAEELNLQRDAAAARYAALKALGRWQEALMVHERVVLLNDSILREENQRELLRSGFKYAYKRAAESDSLRHVAERTRTEAEHREQRTWLLALLAIAAVLGSAAWLRMRYTARAKRIIEAAQEKLVESERAREATEVRMRIARDVHDQLGSDLTKLVLLSTEALEAASSDVEGVKALANDIERIAGEANRSLGDIVWSIDPHHDSLAGLTERVRAHAERMLKWSKVEHGIDCAHEGPDRSLEPAVKRDIYLIFREALNNAIKHSRAERIETRFRTSGTALEFEVKDNGAGIAVDQVRGHGLENMRHRAERCGARLTVESGEGRGTRIHLRMQLT